MPDARRRDKAVWTTGEERQRRRGYSPWKPLGRRHLPRVALSLLITMPALRLRRFALCSQLPPRAPCGFLAGRPVPEGQLDTRFVGHVRGDAAQAILGGVRRLGVVRPRIRLIEQHDVRVPVRGRAWWDRSRRKRRPRACPLPKQDAWVRYRLRSTSPTDGSATRST